jgi:uncharacterized protein YbbK (DUF523 family)
MKNVKTNMLISACLVGICCRYNGKISNSKLSAENINLIKKKYNIITVCPEQLGGLPTPRECSELVGGDGKDLIAGKNVKVISYSGKDVTDIFIKGALETLKIANIVNAKVMVAQMKSPSCSCKVIYDGHFSSKTINGIGVTTAILKQQSDILLIDFSDKDDFMHLF